MLKPIWSAVASAAAGGTPPAAGKDARRLRFSRQVHRFRILGMGLGALCIAAVLYERQAPAAAWALCAWMGLAWPHLAYALARRSADPHRTEVRNLLFDSALVGLWVPLMHFNLLPSVLLLTLVTVDKISTGIPRLWLKSLPGMLAGFVVGGLLTGFEMQLDTSMPVILASLPVLLIHTIAVAVGSNRLVDRIRHKNRQLDELSRIDMLTGLHIRRHWQQIATRVQQRHQQDGMPAALVMLDVDDFKGANDRHGHAFGDDVLRAVARAIRLHVDGRGEAGRYGGDEFGIVLPGSGGNEARFIAEQIRREVEGTRLDAAPDARITISLGIADACSDCATLEQWLEHADAALYRAKRAGRNRVTAYSDAPPSRPHAEPRPS